MFYNIVHDTSVKKWVISCAVLMKVQPFLILCESEDEAKFYKHELCAGGLRIPTQDASQYREITKYPHLSAKIFEVKPIFKAVRRNVDGKVVGEKTGLTLSQAMQEAVQFGDEQDNKHETIIVELG